MLMLDLHFVFVPFSTAKGPWPSGGPEVAFFGDSGGQLLSEYKVARVNEASGG